MTLCLGGEDRREAEPEPLEGEPDDHLHVAPGVPDGNARDSPPAEPQPQESAQAERRDAALGRCMPSQATWQRFASSGAVVRLTDVTPE